MTSLRRISAIFTNTKHTSASLDFADEDALYEQSNDLMTSCRWIGLRSEVLMREEGWIAERTTMWMLLKKVDLLYRLI